MAATCIIHFPITGPVEGEPEITREVYTLCIGEMADWLDVAGMLPQLMTHGLISSVEDMQTVSGGSSNQQRVVLFKKMCGMKGGFQKLYRCLRETQMTHLGHGDAADLLRERGIGREEGYNCPVLSQKSLQCIASL